MTKFLFWTANHNKEGQASLRDVVDIISHQMRALGHAAGWLEENNKLLPRSEGYNVVVEGFTPVVIGTMAEYHAKGARFLILATEEPSDKGFNQGTQAEMVYRQDMFPHAAKFADGILHLVPGDHVNKWYGQFAPSAYAELGYAGTLLRDATNIVPTYDFGFFGSLTNRRKRLLKRLSTRNGGKPVKVVGNFPDQDVRDQKMREVKVILQVRKFDAMGLVSSSRCNTALCIGRPVVAEPHLLSDPWDKVVKFSKSDEEFFDAALFVKAMWRSTWANQVLRFKQLLTPQRCIGEPLRKIGVA